MDYLLYVFILGLVYFIAFFRGQVYMQNKIKKRIEEGISKIPKNKERTILRFTGQVACENEKINLDSIYFSDK